MKHYGLEIPEGTSGVTNLTTPSGIAFPDEENAGELFFKTDENKLYVHGVTVGGSPLDWIDITTQGGGILSVSEDTTPQLGGDLDVNGNSIVSVSNGDITITPDGTGDVLVGAGQIIAPQGSTSDPTYTFDSVTGYGMTYNAGALTFCAGGFGVMKLTTLQVGGDSLYWRGRGGTAAGPGMSFDLDTDTGVYRNSADGLGFATGGEARMTISDTEISVIGDSTGPLEFRLLEDSDNGVEYVGFKAPVDMDAASTGNGASTVWTLPEGDGTNGQVMQTNGSAILSWVDAGGISNIVEDTSPQLGGDLDINGNDIQATTAGQSLTIKTVTNGSGTGGQLNLTAGGSTVSTGGNLSFTAGNGGTGGGSITLNAGSGTVTGGSIFLDVGVDSTDGNINGSVQIRNNLGSTVAPKVLFREGNGSQGVTLKAPDSVTTTRTWVLPEDNPVTANGQFLTTNASGVLSFAAAGGISDIVEDTSPQLGADLDANAFDILFDTSTGIRDENDNEQLIFSTAASAANYLQITNAAVGAAPTLEATGFDTNIDLLLDAKGTGTISLGANLDGNVNEIHADTESESLVFRTAAATDATAGNINILPGGASGTTGAGGAVTLTAGNSTATNSSGGNVNITAGDGTLTSGAILLTVGDDTTDHSSPGYLALRAKGPDTKAPQLRMYESAGGSQFLGFRAPASLSVNSQYTLPELPTGGSKVLQSTTSGVMSWVEALGNPLTADLDVGGFDIIGSPGTAGGYVELKGGIPSDGNGGNVNLAGSAGVGTNRAGGFINIDGGNATGSGVAGKINLTAGDGVSSTGGSIDIDGGASSSSTGGTVSIAGGNGNQGGTVNLDGGNGIGSDKLGGNVNIDGGQSTGVQQGGVITIDAGNSTGSGNGGPVVITGGASTSGNGGAVTIRGGFPTDGNGGAANVTGQNAAGTNNDGGDVVIQPGSATGSGTSGDIKLEPPGGGTEVTIRVGTGVPSHSANNGSLFLRTDGTGPNLYVRENGSWVSK